MDGVLLMVQMRFIVGVVAILSIKKEGGSAWRLNMLQKNSVRAEERV